MLSTLPGRALGVLLLAGALPLAACGAQAPVDRTPGDAVARSSDGKGLATIGTKQAKQRQAAQKERRSREREGTEAAARGTRDFVGDGYAFDAPAGWLDYTPRMKAVQPLIDVAAAESDVEDGFADNVSVLAQPYDGDPEDFFEVASAGLENLVDDTRTIGEVTIAGSSAVHALSHISMGRLLIDSDQYYLVRGDTGVVITFSSLSRTRSEKAAMLDAVLDSWTWHRG